MAYGRGLWTPEEDKKLLLLKEKNVPIKEISAAMGRTVAAIEERLYRTLKKPVKNYKPMPVGWKNILEGRALTMAKNILGSDLVVKNGAYFYKGTYVTVQQILKISGVETPKIRG